MLSVSKVLVFGDDWQEENTANKYISNVTRNIILILVYRVISDT